MRRFALVLILLALLVPGCAAKEAATNAAARSAIGEADRLVAAKRYAEAADRYLDAAGSTKDGALADTALGKAGDAVTASVATKPLPEQVAALSAFAKRLPTGLLPLSAHNWLCARLHDEADAALESATADEAAAHKLVAAYTPPPAPKPAAKKPAKAAPKKTAAAPAAKPAPSAVAASSTPATVPVASPAAARSGTASAPPTPVIGADELRAIAADLPALGQPPAMQRLYAALADLRAAADASVAARAGVAPGGALTLTQRRVLTKAHLTLERTLGKAKGLLASAL